MHALIRGTAFGLVAGLLLATASLADDTVDVTELMTPSPLGDKALGDAAAPVTVIEYASLTCSHCGAFYRETFDAFKTKYIDTGKVHFILREYPLDQLALAAIMGAHCAPETEFFAIVDTLFREQNDWAFVDNPGPALVERLKKHGLSEEAIMTCFGNQDLADKIIAVEQRAGDKFGVEGTPTFFFNGRKQVGEITIDQVDAVMAPLLAKP